MKRILIVSYLFPPMGGIAVQRALSLAKYLPENDFEVHVLTAKNAAGPVYDPGLLANLPPSVMIHNAATAEIPFGIRQRLWRWMGGNAAAPVKKSGGRGATKRSLTTRTVQKLLCPEPEVLWVPWATYRAKRIVKTYGIDVVLVSAPPFSAFLIGNAVKRYFPHVHFVADFRDEWLTFYLNNNEYQNNPHARKKAPLIENDTVALADLVVAVNDSSLKEIRRRYPDEPDRKFVCIQNGYDPTIISDLPPPPARGPGIVVAHGGTVYKNASPRYYLDTIDDLSADLRSRLETWFIGRISNEEEDSFQNRQSIVKRFPFMPQRDALSHLSAADYLLLTMTDPLSIPGKLYEYIALGKPILAFAPSNSEVARMMKQFGLGCCLDPADPGNCHNLLNNIFSTGILPANTRAPFQRFDRRTLAMEYAAHVLALSHQKT